MGNIFNINDLFKTFALDVRTPATVTRYNSIGRPMNMPVKLNGIWLPEQPVLLLSMSKNIERTKLAGHTRRGTVKQLISENDIRIQIRGFVANHETNEYPLESMEILRDIYLQNKSIEIESMLTDLWDVDRIVIEDFDMAELKGTNVQFYYMSCMSDEDFLLVAES